MQNDRSVTVMNDVDLREIAMFRFFDALFPGVIR